MGYQGRGQDEAARGSETSARSEAQQVKEHFDMCLERPCHYCRYFSPPNSSYGPRSPPDPLSLTLLGSMEYSAPLCMLLSGVELTLLPRLSYAPPPLSCRPCCMLRAFRMLKLAALRPVKCTLEVGEEGAAAACCSVSWEVERRRMDGALLRISRISGLSVTYPDW